MSPRGDRGPHVPRAPRWACIGSLDVRPTAVDQARQRMASGIRKMDSTCSYVEPGMVEFALKIEREDHQLKIISKLSTPEQLFLRGRDATEEFY